MKYYSLQQDYEELISLENLLLDCRRRLILAGESGLSGIEKKDEVRLVGTGFSAVLAFHALRAHCRVSAVYDTAAKTGTIDLPGVETLPFSALSTDESTPVIVACAPGMAGEIMARVDSAGSGAERVLLFAHGDEVNSLERSDDSGWLHLNMSYRCVNVAVNMARRYRPVVLGASAPVHVMGTGLAGLLARHGVSMARMECGGYVDQAPLPEGSDLLVTVAPETFAGNERELCGGIPCRSAQFLFRRGDGEIPAWSMDGFTGCRLLGGGEEGYVFDANGPDGKRYCFKRFYTERDRSREIEWCRSFADGPSCLSWMGEVQGIPGDGAETGICYPYVELAHIPFMDESRDATLRATVAYCLQFQQAHVEKGRAPSTMPGGIHALCDRSGVLRFIDIGNFPPALAECDPERLKGYVIKGLAGLTHETLFSGKGWKNLESEESRRILADRLETSASELPGWYVNLLCEVLALPAGRFGETATYAGLVDKYALDTPVLAQEVAERAHSLTPVPAPGPMDGGWYQERIYQSYRYKAGNLEGSGRTGSKYGLIRESFEELVSGSSYLDIGSNMGFFVGKAALLTEKQCIGIEKRGEFRLQSERMFKEIGANNAKVVNTNVVLGTPLPESDVMSAFAIIHHLYLMGGSFSSLEAMVGYMADSVRKSLFIEYVYNPGYLERAEALHKRAFDDYTEQGMVDALSQHFPSVRKLAEVSPTRTVYLAERG